MSLKYNGSTVTGDEWLRAARIVIENPLDQPKNIMFVEENCITIGDRNITEARGVLSKMIHPGNMYTSFEIVNPETGIPTGNTITYAEVYALIYSVYMAVAKERDNPVEVVEEIVEDPDAAPLE